MPRYPINTSLTKDEMQRVKDAARRKGMSIYRFVKEAVVRFARE